MEVANNAGEAGFDPGGGDSALKPPGNRAGDAARDEGGGDKARRAIEGGAGDATLDFGGGESVRNATVRAGLDLVESAGAGVGELFHGNDDGSWACTPVAAAAPGGGASVIGSGERGAGHVPWRDAAFCTRSCAALWSTLEPVREWPCIGGGFGAGGKVGIGGESSDMSLLLDVPVFVTKFAPGGGSIWGSGVRGAGHTAELAAAIFTRLIVGR